MRVALVGWGEAGQALAAVVREAPGASVAWVVDGDARRARAAAQQLGAAWGTDVEEALLGGVDAVAAAPQAGRAAARNLALVTETALARGVHVFVQPPLALRWPDAARLQARALQSEAMAAVDFWARGADGVRVLRGRLPRPRFVQIEALTDPLHGRREGRASHGGVLAFLGSQAFDLACYLAGSRPLHVQASGGRHTRRADLADTASAAICFASGALARVVVGEFGGVPAGSAWRVTATDGAETVSLSHNLQRAEVHRQGRAPRVYDHADAETDAPQARALRAFLAAAAGEGRPLAGFDDGARAVQLADAVYEAMRERARVPLAETPSGFGGRGLYAYDPVANRRNRGLGS